MSTATEIQMRMAEAQPTLEAMRRHFERVSDDLAIYGTFVGLWRYVCARRARKLRRRGEYVRYAGTSKNGKPRFSWVRRVDSETMYRGRAAAAIGESK